MKRTSRVFTVDNAELCPPQERGSLSKHRFFPAGYSVTSFKSTHFCEGGTLKEMFRRSPRGNLMCMERGAQSMWYSKNLQSLFEHLQIVKHRKTRAAPPSLRQQRSAGPFLPYSASLLRFFSPLQSTSRAPRRPRFLAHAMRWPLQYMAHRFLVYPTAEYASRPKEAPKFAHALRRPSQYMAQYGVHSIKTEVFVDTLAPLALPRRTSAIARIRWRNPGHTIGLPFSHDPPLGRMACALRTDLAVHARRIAYHQPQLVVTF